MSNLRTIKIRGDSTENWELANPILEYKEMACEFADNGTFFKIGNGIDSWNDLAYVSVNGGIEEAPIDDKQYARKNAGWEEVVSGGGGIAIEDVTGLSEHLNDIDVLIGDVESALIAINGEP